MSEKKFFVLDVRLVARGDKDQEETNRFYKLWEAEPQKICFEDMYCFPPPDTKEEWEQINKQELVPEMKDYYPEWKWEGENEWGGYCTMYKMPYDMELSEVNGLDGYSRVDEVCSIVREVNEDEFKRLKAAEKRFEQIEASYTASLLFGSSFDV